MYMQVAIAWLVIGIPYWIIYLGGYVERTPFVRASMAICGAITMYIGIAFVLTIIRIRQYIESKEKV